jgi:hypothetical protein
MNIEALSDDTAVQAISRISKEWLTNRGVEAYVVVEGAKRKAQISYQHLPDWIAGIPEGTQAAGELARLMLGALLEAEDEEVATWTKQAINEASVPKAQVDPITLSILGAILIGSILAARVKKVGSVEFYQGVPKELADVLKAGTTIAVPK